MHMCYYDYNTLIFYTTHCLFYLVTFAVAAAALPTHTFHPRSSILSAPPRHTCTHKVGGRTMRYDRLRKGAIGEQHGGRQMFGLSVCTGICLEAHRRGVQDSVIQPIESGVTRTLHVVNGYDGTPMTFEFGAMASNLLPVARFPPLDGDGKWKLLSAEKYADVTGYGAPHRGVLEVFAQRVEVCSSGTGAGLGWAG